MRQEFRCAGGDVTPSKSLSTDVALLFTSVAAPKFDVAAVAAPKFDVAAVAAPKADTTASTCAAVVASSHDTDTWSSSTSQTLMPRAFASSRTFAARPGTRASTVSKNAL